MQFCSHFALFYDWLRQTNILVSIFVSCCLMSLYGVFFLDLMDKLFHELLVVIAYFTTWSQKGPMLVITFCWCYEYDETTFSVCVCVCAFVEWLSCISCLLDELMVWIVCKIAAEAILLGFQHYLVMLGTTVLIPTTLVPQMGGGNVSVKWSSSLNLGRSCFLFWLYILFAQFGSLCLF